VVIVLAFYSTFDILHMYFEVNQPIERIIMLGVYQQLNAIFDLRCIELASDAEEMERFRASAFYAKHMALGRTECQAICCAVQLDMQ
jgi:hypothetical protein